jgi:hypothetical protein
VVKVSWQAGTVGASSKEHALARAKVLDGFGTPEIAVKTLLSREAFHTNVWEPANGYGDITFPLEDAGYDVFTSDIFRWHKSTHTQRSFFDFTRLPYGDDYDIITNPPFKLANQFVTHSHKLLRKGGRLALLLRLQFLEGITRRETIFDVNPPYIVYVYSFRLPRMHRFDYDEAGSTSMLAFAWMIWEKGYKGSTVVKWI